MVVYSLIPHEEVAGVLQQGLKRTAGRVYVFSSWSPVATCLQAYAQEAGAEDAVSAIRVLVLDVDEDILAAGPVPRSRLPPEFECGRGGDTPGRIFVYRNRS